MNLDEIDTFVEKIQDIRDQLRNRQPKNVLDELKKEYARVLGEVETYNNFILPTLLRDVDDDIQKLSSARTILEDIRSSIESENACGIDALKNHLQVKLYLIMPMLSDLVPLNQFRVAFENELNRTNIGFPGIIVIVGGMLKQVGTLMNEKVLKRVRILSKQNVLNSIEPIPEKSFETQKQRQTNREKAIAEIRKRNAENAETKRLIKQQEQKRREKRNAAIRAARMKRLGQVVERLYDGI